MLLTSGSVNDVTNNEEETVEMAITTAMVELKEYCPDLNIVALSKNREDDVSITFTRN